MNGVSTNRKLDKQFGCPYFSFETLISNADRLDWALCSMSLSLSMRKDENVPWSFQHYRTKILMQSFVITYDFQECQVHLWINSVLWKTFQRFFYFRKIFPLIEIRKRIRAKELWKIDYPQKTFQSREQTRFCRSNWRVV